MAIRRYCRYRGTLFHKFHRGKNMKKYFVGLVLSASALTVGYSAFAAIYGNIWAYDVNGVVRCFAKNSAGGVARDTVSIPNEFCQFSYAWGRDIYNNIACFPVSVNGTFLPNAVSVPAPSCAKAYIFGRDNMGIVRCFGQGPDGNILINSFSVDPVFCNN